MALIQAILADNDANFDATVASLMPLLCLQETAFPGGGCFSWLFMNSLYFLKKIRPTACLHDPLCLDNPLAKIPQLPIEINAISMCLHGGFNPSRLLGKISKILGKIFCLAEMSSSYKNKKVRLSA